MSRQNPHRQELRPIGPTHKDGRFMGTVLLAGDNGNWVRARIEQVQAYKWLVTQKTRPRPYKFNYVLEDGKAKHLNVRSRLFIPDGPYVHSHEQVYEIQDPNPGGPWRAIKELERAPTPQSS